MAVAAIVAAEEVERGVLLDSFVDAGGLAAVVQLLRKSRCPTTLACAATLMQRLLDPQAGPHGRPGGSSDIADSVFQLGELGVHDNVS
jgi:hypothetical protein